MKKPKSWTTFFFSRITVSWLNQWNCFVKKKTTTTTKILRHFEIYQISCVKGGGGVFRTATNTLSCGFFLLIDNKDRLIQINTDLYLCVLCTGQPLISYWVLLLSHIFITTTAFYVIFEWNISGWFTCV